MKKKRLALFLGAIISIVTGTVLVAKIDFGKIGKGIEKGLEPVEKGLEKGVGQIGKNVETVSINLNREAELLVNKVFSRAQLNIPAVVQDIVQIENDIKGLAVDLNHASAVLKAGLLAEGKKIVNDFDQLQKDAKKILDSGNITLNDIISAITNRSKLAELVGKLNQQEILALNDFSTAQTQLLEDIDSLEFKPALDLATDVTRKIANIFNNLKNIEKNTGGLNKIIIPPSLQKALNIVTNHLNNLASHVSLIYQPIGLTSKDLVLKLALGLMSNLSKLEDIKNKINQAITTTQTQIQFINNKVQLLPSIVTNLTEDAKAIKQKLINQLVKKFSHNPALIITKGPEEVENMIELVLKPFSLDIAKFLSLIHDLLSEVSIILKDNAKTGQDFNELLGKEAVIPQKSINAIKETSTDIENLSKDLANLNNAL